MAQTLFTGKNIITLQQVGSTNDYARELLASGPVPEGTLIIARAQTAGRGQQGNAWLSEPDKNLTVSFIFYPDFLEPPNQFYLNMCAALAVKDFAESVVKDRICIKWPNDIYAGDSKLAGILIENTIAGNKITHSIIGIGINVNQETFSEELKNPTSLYLLTAITYNLNTLAELLCLYVEKYYLQLRMRHFNFLARAYTESLYRYQQTHEFKKGDQIIRGEICGVSKDGKLILQSAGKEHRYGFKEIEFLI
ncbi:MAG: biotin--[acetyl-CoA-carboxylase] ligase [Chitinophagales bacterium]|nr:biotin--[acetyl-CoA-carboxylase] ligase [Chitinophagales bacterium]MDW8418551.1 biotin--[acetyl-CoA-carboxylase] ligase [Chitinophagales bacterium]